MKSKKEPKKNRFSDDFTGDNHKVGHARKLGQNVTVYTRSFVFPTIKKVDDTKQIIKTKIGRQELW